MTPSNPYAAPIADRHVVPVPDHYVDQSSRVRLLRGLLLGAVVMSVLLLVSNALQLSLFDRAKLGNVTMEQAVANDQRQAVLALLGVLLFVVTAVVFGRFLVRANKNARRLSEHADLLTVSPGWMVGWFFIPFANLWKPLLGVRETWALSQARVPAYVTVWWLVWIGRGVVNWVAGKAEAGDTIPQLITMTKVDMFGDLLGGVLAVAAIAVVSGLHEAQQRHQATGRRDDAA